MLTNLKILDYDLQISRIFGLFIKSDLHKYDNCETMNGIYDLVFTHREGTQDRFEELIPHINSSTKIITDITTESGNIDSFLIKYKEIVSAYSNQFYLICDTIIPNKSKYPSNLKILDSYELVYYSHLNDASDNFHMLKTDIDSYEHNGFLSLNNSCRLHRVYLLTQLLSRNISLDKCSFLFSTGTPTGWKYNANVFKDCIDELKHKKVISDELYTKTLNYPLPKTLDYDNRNGVFIYNELNEELYKTILNLVTENLTGMTEGDISNDGIYTFTEKSIKPFLSKQIPLFFALPGHINLLREIGFDMYDDLVDHSYDTELDSTKRLNLILNELERLLKIDLIDFKNKNKSRFDFNFELLNTLNQIGEGQLKSFLYDEILK